MRYDDTDKTIYILINGEWVAWKKAIESQTYWTNSKTNDTSLGFPAQTIVNGEINLSLYSTVEVTFGYWADDLNQSTFTAQIGGDSVLAICKKSSSAIYSCRRFRATTEGIIFDIGHDTGAESGTSYTVACIPIKIVVKP